MGLTVERKAFFDGALAGALVVCVLWWLFIHFGAYKCDLEPLSTIEWEIEGERYEMTPEEYRVFRQALKEESK